ncbi:MAG: undecaprenyldiphospho-muramoylpentapeptide beta-N-acetylglucosaminyltransferase [Microthrixaceae bacterium]
MSRPAAATYAIVTGGGTAGHVLPALAIAEAIVAAGHRRESVHYVGSLRGIEASLVPPTGFPMTLLPGRGIQRRLTPANVTAAGGLLIAVARSILLVRRLRPAIVIAVGGYASVAVALAAALWRVPVVVAEQNAVPGAANRLIARFARVSAVSYPGTTLPRAVVTGNPVRAEILEIDPARDRHAARRAFGVGEGRRLVLVVGGSLGARRINRAVLDALPRWADRGDLSIHHIVGARDWEEVERSSSTDLARLEYRRVRYEENMPAALAAADVAICRSGASTCFELAAVGLPAVLVPSPHVTADQQTRNARPLAEAGGAILVPDAELDGSRLVREVDALLGDDTRRAAMAQAALAWARPNAASEIAGLAAEHARV